MKIIILQSNDNITPYLSKSLEMAGFRTTIVAGLEELTKKAKGDVNSLLIIDNAKVVSEIELTNHILVLSKSIGSSSKLNFLEKPFAIQNLILKVQEIEKSTTTRNSIVEIEDLIIDLDNKEITRAGKDIVVTKKEFLLLTYLLKNKGKAVPRADLLEYVWGMQIDPFSNTVEAHIFSLRKKIDRGHNIKLIHTIPKFGYKVSTEK